MYRHKNALNITEINVRDQADYTSCQICFSNKCATTFVCKRGSFCGPLLLCWLDELSDQTVAMGYKLRMTQGTHLNIYQQSRSALQLQDSRALVKGKRSRAVPYFNAKVKYLQKSAVPELSHKKEEFSFV